MSSFEPQRRVILILLGLAALFACEQARVQPIPFNHKIHVVDNDIDCTDCHQYVMERPFAGIPRVETCMECHEDDITENPDAEPYIDLIRKHAEEGTELGWQRLYELEQMAYYSHRRHVKIAKLECEVCHGDIGKSTSPPPLPRSKTLTMSNCLKCHEQNGVENDCAWCHR